ncbi:ubiquitin carboxyl-terminal hydrolase [Acanthamoeba castellanii str. Neff]|uniref:Ubiquitin carboxyl-terminal hydrolase n=1 Tax=Acanthamoeba castellanii (strain ATCC 30010 / Neff) TaxID=1257118 RepID=L8HG84_ACACF|nr:ubiquitin carboxyl-terminal hydrolase [Acanthamoeba castellanii str. Neff]ELR24267.1 ubiquitin carboxyl-terminal hydrolase [Acanthamoeba castellanii str. Neff]
MGSTLYHARPRPFTRDTTIGDYFPSYDRWATSNTGAHHYDFDRHNAELEELDRSGRRARSASGGLGIVNRSWATSPVTSPVLSSRPAFKREGLQNLGNTCYMNAVLQSLLSLETFVSDMNRDEFIQALPYTSFYQALLQIAVEMRREKHGIINPWPVKDAVARMAKQFSDWMQQDAHEFLVSCLDQLEGEIDKIGQDSREKAKAEVGASSSSSTLVILSEEEKQAERVRNDKCPIFLNFESEVEHTFTCRNPACENVARKPEIFRDFSLEIIEPPPGASETDKRSNKPSVQDLVKFWFQGDEVVEMRCGKCEEAGEADVGHNFLRLPRVLILHLKRFKPLPTDIFTIRKLQDMVRLNKTIDLGPLNLPSHDAAFSPTSRSPSSSHSPSSAPSPSPSSPFSTSVASVKSAEFKVPAPHSKVVVPPTSSFPTGGAKGGERIDDDLSTIIEGSLANNKRQRTQSSDSTSTSTNGTKLSEEEMMARALKESEMTFAAVEQAKEEERIRKEQEELDMAIALSLEEGQDDEQRVSMKRKRSTNATEVPPEIIV